MPQHLTLKDIHARDDAVGPLIEENLDVAPAFARTPVKRINGLSYKQAVRKALPGGEFTDVGQGAKVTASEYDFVDYICHHLEGQLEVYESVIKARKKGEGMESEDILAEEAAGFMRNQMIYFDNQFFKGKASGVPGAKKGFAGLENLTAATMTLGAGGTSSALASAYLVFESVEQGVSFVMPNGEEFELSPWNFGQLITAGSRGGGDLRKTNGWSSGATGYLGLKATKPERCILRVCNIDKSNPLTDEIGSLAHALFKAGFKPTACYMNEMTRFYLQRGRNATTIMNGNKTATGADIIAPTPTTLAGVPIVLTDSLGFDESEVTGANARLDNLLPAEA